MDKDKTRKDSKREASEGDYTDPGKSKEVDWSYDPGYLRRRGAFVKDMQKRMRRKRRDA